jgi:2-amino-4-hydroxy-6-hydroxymethyldihydropteridine diphosphokinase
MATAYIALGSNLGDRLETLRAAVRRLSSIGRVTGVSPVYETAPIGFQDQPQFLNAVVSLWTDLPPTLLLSALHRIEAERGRIRTFRFGPRTLDLDLLVYDDLIIDDQTLTVPHPRLHERGFVLAPFADVAPNLVHPSLKKTIAELWREREPTESGLALTPDSIGRMATSR